ncbi:hypothetical protein [Moritella marina]|uniref:hypothetical protein n=1 Tax=Moritella marina TaxID=90736 RepID=UPI0037049E0A
MNVENIYTWSDKHKNKLKLLFTVLIYLSFLLTAFNFSSTLGDLKILGTEFKNTEFVEVNKYSNFKEFWILNFLDVLYLVSSVLLLSFSYFKLPHWLHSGLEERVIGSTVSIQILTVATLVIGIYSSVTSAAILDWFSPKADKFGYAQYNIDMIIFVLAVVFLGFVRHGMLSAKLHKQERDEYKENVTQLERVIRLAPPGKFASQLAHYGDILEDLSFDKFSKKGFDFLDSSDRKLSDWNDVVEEQQNTIRACLIAFSRLAGSYDNAPLGVGSELEYRANLMFNTDDDKLLKVLQEGKKHRDTFSIGLNSKPTFQLVLNSEYSVLVTTEDETIINELDATSDYEVKPFEKDNQICDAVFPVYIEKKTAPEDANSHSNKASVYNLFGAPESIYSCHPKFISDTDYFASRLHERGTPKPLAEAAINYYKSDVKGKSIVSLPLSTSRFLQSKLKPSSMNAVVNIYRNKSNLFLGDEDKFNTFCHLTLPLQISLSRLVVLHSAILLEKSNCS